MSVQSYAGGTARRIWIIAFPGTPDGSFQVSKVAFPESPGRSFAEKPVGAGRSAEGGGEVSGDTANAGEGKRTRSDARSGAACCDRNARKRLRTPFRIEATLGDAGGRCQHGFSSPHPHDRPDVDRKRGPRRAEKAENVLHPLPGVVLDPPGKERGKKLRSEPRVPELAHEPEGIELPLGVLAVAGMPVEEGGPGRETARFPIFADGVQDVL